MNLCVASNFLCCVFFPDLPVKSHLKSFSLSPVYLAFSRQRISYELVIVTPKSAMQRFPLTKQLRCTIKEKHFEFIIQHFSDKIYVIISQKDRIGQMVPPSTAFPLFFHTPYKLYPPHTHTTKQTKNKHSSQPTQQKVWPPAKHFTI